MNDIVELDKQAVVAAKQWKEEAEALPSYAKLLERESDPSLTQDERDAIGNAWLEETLALPSYKVWRDLRKQIMEIIISEQ